MVANARLVFQRIAHIFDNTFFIKSKTIVNFKVSLQYPYFLITTITS